MTASIRLPARLSLLGGFRLTVGGSAVGLPIHAQRVLAFLALGQPNRPAARRAALAERLWADASVERSQASLRTALWRIRQAGEHLVVASRETIQLGDAVAVDVRESMGQAARLLADDRDLRAGDTDVSRLSGELLPGWEEDWLQLERERIRQVHIHALEALAHRLRRLGRHLEAIEAAYAAIAEEPLRESAHAALIDAYLTEGNRAQAQSHLDRFADLLWAELGIKPAIDLRVRELTARSR
jgi:DNA-binding SARP family transcriptional activator